MAEKIPFNKAHMTGVELQYITEAKSNCMLSGDGPFTKRCQQLLEEQTKSQKVLLTHSCTGALEMAALILDIQPGDEIIMPAYTFVSTANAFALRGGVPVFIDIRPDTLNMDEKLIEAAITKRTKAIVPVHYAGVSCAMDEIMATAKRHNLYVIEDAAQGMMSTYKGRALGSIGELGAFSFHETKNITCGEGGALLVNQANFSLKSEIVREKGTDRSRFFRGEVDKYTWQDLGSSFLPGEITTAFLLAQLEAAESITARRLQAWQYYHELLAPMEQQGLLRRPIVPEDCKQNAHMYYILLSPDIERQLVLEYLKAQNIFCMFHYVPLHSSPAGKRVARAHGSLEHTVNLSQRLVRLPLWYDLQQSQQDRVITELQKAMLR